MNGYRLTPALRALAPTLPAILALGATLPLGSAHPVYRLAGSALLWLFVAAIFAVRRPRPPARDSYSGLLRWASGGLLAWLFLQCLRLPWPPPFCSGRPWISTEPGYSLLITSVWASYVGFALATARICVRRASMERAAFALMMAGVFACMLAFSRFAYPQPGADPFFTARFRGSFSSGNALAGFLLLTLSASLGLLLHRWPGMEQEWMAARSRGRHIAQRWVHHGSRIVLPFSACALQVVCVVMTGSRGAMVAGGAMVVLLALRFLRAEPPALLRQRVLVVLAGLSFFTVLGLGGGFWIARQRLAALVEEGEEGASISMRMEIWRATLAEIRRQPLGVGLGNFEDAYAGALPASPAGSRAYHAHNDYLESLAELGVPGMVCLLVLLATFLTRHARWMTRSKDGDSFRWLPRAIWAGLIATLLHAAVDFNFSSRPAIPIAFFLCAGMLEAARPRKASTVSGSVPVCVAEDLPQKPARRHRGVLALPVCLALVSGLHAVGEAYAEKGWIAAGGAPNPYLGNHLYAASAPSETWFRLATRLSPLNAAPLVRRAEALLFLDPRQQEARLAWRTFSFFPPPPGRIRGAMQNALQGEALLLSARLNPWLAELAHRTAKPGITSVVFKWNAWLSGGSRKIWSPGLDAPSTPRGQSNDADTFLRLFELHLISLSPRDSPDTSVYLHHAEEFLRRFPLRTSDLLDLIPEEIPLDELLDRNYAPVAYQTLAGSLNRFVVSGIQDLFFQYWGQAIETTPGLGSQKQRRLRLEWARSYVAAMTEKGDWASASDGQEQFRTHRALGNATPLGKPGTRPALLQLEKLFQESSLTQLEKQALLESAIETRKTGLAADLRASMETPAPPPPEEGRVDTGLVFGNDALDWIGYRIAREDRTHVWTFTAWLRPRRSLPVDLEMRVGVVAGDLVFASDTIRLQEAAPEVFHYGDPQRNQILVASVSLPVQQAPNRLRLSFASPKARTLLSSLEGLPSLTFPVDPPEQAIAIPKTAKP